MSQPVLRVLHILGELRPSGAETMLVAAAPLFRAGGVVLDVLSTGATPGPYAARFQAAGFGMQHLPFARSAWFFLRVRRLIRAGRYDVVHLHTEAANFWFGLAARSVAAPVVLRTVHNSFAFAGHLQWRRGLQRRLLARLGVRHVAISYSVRDTELRHFRLATTLVWNWYDSRRFTATTSTQRVAARTVFGLAPADFTIAGIGNCSSVKNHAALIEAIAALPPGQRPVYLHAGQEEPGLPERRLAQRLGVAQHIRFLGPLADVLPLLQAADAYVMPSVFEGFGIAAVEALGTGLPGLFTDVAGLRDFRADFPHLVYCGTSAPAIAAGLQALARMHAVTRAEIRATYPVIARRRFGIERGVQEYLALYRDGTMRDVGAPDGLMPEKSRA